MDRRENVHPDQSEVRNESATDSFPASPTRLLAIGMKKKTPLIEFEVHDTVGLKHLLRRAKVLAAFCGLSAARQQQFGKRVLESARTMALQPPGCAISFWLALKDPQATANDSSRHFLAVDVWQLPSRDEPIGNDLQLASPRSTQEDWERVSTARLEQALPIDFAIPSALDLNLWREAARQKSYEAALDTIYRRSKERYSLLAEARQSVVAPAESDSAIADPETQFLLSLVASKTDNAVAILDATGAIEWTNAAFSQVTGLSEQEACTQPLERVLFPAGTSQRRLKQFRLALRSGKSLVEEGHHPRADGSETWTTFQLTPLHDKANRLVRWIAIGANTTKRRETEQALQAAKLAAESASRSKSEFLANISHEIRTPMNIIMGMSQLALSDSESPRQREFLQAIQSSAELLLQILNDVLDLSKIEAAKLELETGDFNLADLVRDTLVSMAVAAETKGLNLAWDFYPDIPQLLRGDGLRIRQVLVNLVGNAIKFTGQGMVKVTVHRAWENRSDVGLRFAVSDSGIGIPADRLERIFDAFTQADSSTTRQFGGSGLGLTITADLVRLMNGRIWVESELGRGSTFTFELQLKKQVQGSDESRPALKLPATFITQPGNAITPIAVFCKKYSQPLLCLNWIEIFDRVSGSDPGMLAAPTVILETSHPNLELPKFAEAANTGDFSLAKVIPVVPPDHYYLARQLWQELGGSQILVQPITLQSVQKALDESIRGYARSVSESAPIANEFSPPASPHARFSRRVLVVDDHLPNRQLIVHALGRIGHRVTEAATGQQAIDLILNDHFDLVLMDVQMPELDGLDTTRRIRNGPPPQNSIPIVGVTAYALHGDRQKCLQAGMNDYLTKPIDVRELTKIVESHSALAKTETSIGVQREHAEQGPPLFPESRPTLHLSADSRVARSGISLNDGALRKPHVIRQFQATWDRLGQDEALFRRQLQFLKEEVPEMLAQLTLASTELRFDAMATFAHRLAGLLGTFDEQQGADLARRIEGLSLSQSTRGIKNLLDQLGKKIDKLLGSCRQL